MTKKTITCTNHCGDCGRCFHSLEAFDAYRLGGFSAPADWGEAQRCLAPIQVVDRDGVERLVALTDSGECRRYVKAEVRVMVWTRTAGITSIHALIRARDEAAKAVGAREAMSALPAA